MDRAASRMSLCYTDLSRSLPLVINAEIYSSLTGLNWKYSPLLIQPYLGMWFSLPREPIMAFAFESSNLEQEKHLSKLIDENFLVHKMTQMKQSLIISALVPILRRILLNTNSLNEFTETEILGAA